MIILKKLKFSNAFSYGEGNEIDFTTSPLTQLVGKNGHGKSSIALILEEVLFNKNSKGIKKGDILNRHLDAKAYTIELELSKDGVQYKIETKRGSTQAVKFYRADTDISSHTSTQTYKQIESVIGMDHKTFSQIVYQSSASSLEFLTSPDTARKKFLIEILNLGKYTQAGEVFKAAAAEVAKELAIAEGKVTTVKQWVQKYGGMDFTPKPLVYVPADPTALVQEATLLEHSISNIESTNKKISQNNKYKALQAKLVVLPLPPEPAESDRTYVSISSAATYAYTAAKATRDKLLKLHGTCPTCLSDIDDCKTTSMVAEQEHTMKIAKVEEAKANAKIVSIKEETEAWKAAAKSHEEYNKYSQLIDPDLQPELLDEAHLTQKYATISTEISKILRSISAAEVENKAISAENAKRALLAGQLAEMTAELSALISSADAIGAKLNTLNTLVKTFSTTGLVAYKIENLVKDLEELSNSYLGELSGGRFQISFQISGSDKLNVVITDNGTDIDIAALSGGERARVNVAALLAIRKLMQALSDSRINLLILDETVDALDVEGKEKLVEVLLAEPDLNTVLVSHAFTHPLLEKVHVIKTNNISRIEA